MTAEGLAAAVEAIIVSRLANVAEQIADDAKDEYDSVIDTFYGEYSPSRYARNYDMYNASERVSESFGKGIRAGVKLNPGALSPNHDSSEYVYSGAFGMGIHGTSAIMVGSPGRTTMDSWYESYKGYLPAIVRAAIGSLSL